MSEREQSTAATATVIPPELLARLARVDPCALDRLVSGGLGSFNPFIGVSAEHTFENLGAAMALLHAVLSSDVDQYETRRGMALYVETMWAAVQYEESRRKPQGAKP